MSQLADVARSEYERGYEQGKADSVRHGYWEQYTRQNGEVWYRCNVCKKYHFHNGEMLKLYKHCPNCGARMDAQEEAEHV